MARCAPALLALTFATTIATCASDAPADSHFRLPAGFIVQKIANVPGARELATLPNGDVLVGTSGTSIYIVPDAEAAGSPGDAHVFATLAQGPAAGVAYAPSGAIYAASNSTIWKIPYRAGAQSAAGATAIARVRTGPIAPNSDGDVHRTTSVAATEDAVYASIGSSCNACVEADPTRATVQQMKPDGSDMHLYAKRTRNAIALTIEPDTGALWIGGAGQDGLAYGHPYEYVDEPSAHGRAPFDYGWPACEENRHAYNSLHENPTPDCSRTVAPEIAFPAYATLIAAAFYPRHPAGPYAFPSAYRGGIFVTSHGSWHCCPATPPRVYFVPMNGSRPGREVDWSDPNVQHSVFLSGLGSTESTASYVARPTGVTVGTRGSVFIADDLGGAIYRIRPDAGVKPL